MALIKRLAWLYQRLRKMAPAEVLHRVAEQFGLLQMYLRYRVSDAPWGVAHSGFFLASGEPVFLELTWDEPALVADTTDILEGRWPALGFAWTWHDTGDVWRRAPDTGNIWGNGWFNAIDYRIHTPGDIRVAWEPARLQQLVALALVARRASDPGEARRALELLSRQLRSWRSLNPSMDGIHYISAMECGLRILSVAFAVDIARGVGEPGDDLFRDVGWLVHDHAMYISRRISAHSSAGNHTVAECAGLVCAAIVLANSPHADSWMASGLRHLRREAARQVLPDGGGLEQAPWYLAFVLDLLGIVALMSESVGRAVPREIADALERGRGLLASLSTAYDDIPRIGDSDDGYALTPYLRLSWQGGTAAQDTHCFRDAGYTVVRRDGEFGQHLVFDHGPLGMAPCYGHGHADALSVLWSALGVDILVDPGTYMYNADERRRAWYRGTAAHNCVILNGQDQARQLSRFMWENPYNINVLHWEVRDDGVVCVVATHDAYQQRFGARVVRALALVPGCGLIVLDQLDGTGRQEMALNWHCGPEPVAAGPGVVLGTAAGDVYACFEGGELTLETRQDIGENNYYSMYYGDEARAGLIAVSHTGELPHEFVSVFSLQPETDWSRAEIETLRMRCP